jgi:RNase HI (EC 3.1.26.4)
MKTIKIFADGSSLGNPGPGGYCSIIVGEEKRVIVKGGEKLTTNNRMELMAVIKALEKIKNSYNIELYTDSKYVVDGINSWLEKWKKNGWKTSNKKDVLNIDLWQKLDQLLQRHNVKAYWIKGHNGHPENEYCDKLAKMEALKYMQNEEK